MANLAYLSVEARSADLLAAIFNHLQNVIQKRKCGRVNLWPIGC